jgi:hypothetical protein
VQSTILEGTVVEYSLEITMVTTHSVDHMTWGRRCHCTEGILIVVINKWEEFIQTDESYKAREKKDRQIELTLVLFLEIKQVRSKERHRHPALRSSSHPWWPSSTSHSPYRTVYIARRGNPFPSSFFLLRFSSCLVTFFLLDSHLP